MATPLALHLTGTILLDGETTCPEAWVHEGRFWLEQPTDLEPSAQLHGWFLPGLVDMHCHVGLGVEGSVNHGLAEAQAIADRDSGVLLIRDAGSPLDTHWLGDDPAMPIIVRAGQHIAREKRYLRNYAREIAPGDLGREVVRQVAAGDGWVKIVADWIDRDLGDLAPLWSYSELSDAVALAHEAGSRVTAHTFGTEALAVLLDAGVDCVEHATGADEAIADQLAHQGVPVVPTMIQRGNFVGIARAARKYPRFAERISRLHESRYEHLAMLADKGVRLLAGTDAGGTIGHGLIASELKSWEIAGISNRTIVGAASWDARGFLGFPALANGERADIVGLREDPRENLDALLRDPLRVILAGAIVR